MKTNGGFLVTKIKQLGDRIFERILAEKKTLMHLTELREGFFMSYGRKMVFLLKLFPRKADLQLLHLRPCLSGWKKTD